MVTETDRCAIYGDDLHQEGECIKEPTEDEPAVHVEVEEGFVEDWDLEHEWP